MTTVSRGLLTRLLACLLSVLLLLIDGSKIEAGDTLPRSTHKGNTTCTNMLMIVKSHTSQTVKSIKSRTQVSIIRATSTYTVGEVKKKTCLCILPHVEKVKEETSFFFFSSQMWPPQHIFHLNKSAGLWIFQDGRQTYVDRFSTANGKVDAGV